MNVSTDPVETAEPRFTDYTRQASAERQLEVVAALREILAPGALLFREEDTRPFECDGLTAFRQLPMVVALPETEQQVCRILKVCKAMEVPVVARGAGTGLSGGAMPHAAGVVLSLAKFNRIIAVDPVSRTARVQPGVRNLAISEAAAPYDLYYAPDPSSQIACTIGGNVSENSGGVHCLKYGLTVHNVLAIRAITIDGEVMTLGSAIGGAGAALDSPGLDLMALLVGSEGMLAVVSEVVVKLIPKPLLARVIMASFDDVQKAGDAVAAIIAAGIIPAGMEMMDKKASGAVEPFVKAGYDLEAEAILLVESDGTPEEVAEEIEAIEQVLREAGCDPPVGLGLRGGASQILVRPKERLSGGRPDFSRLLLHGRHHSAQGVGADAAGHCRHGEAIPVALHERVPRR